MKDRTRVAILLGGRSAEHEVSLQSARNVLRTLDPDRFETIPITIDKQGVWALADPARLLEEDTDPAHIHLAGTGTRVVLLPWPDPQPLWEPDSHRRHSLDVVFPILHGPYGEDGTLQGLLEMAGLPYVGAGVLGSAAAMDKDVAKRLLAEAGLAVARGITLHPDHPPVEKVSQVLGWPLFVKPANLGSSVGVRKARTWEDLADAIDQAFRYDNKVIVEEFIQGREIECSVLGNEHPEASLPGEIIPRHEFYSYQAKYLDADGAELCIPADLDPQTIREVQTQAIQAFQALGCQGMARVDFFVTPVGQILVNEVNTIPGFTDISMYPKLWEATGLPQARLLEKLIDLAIERTRARRALLTDYRDPAKDS